MSTDTKTGVDTNGNYYENNVKQTDGFFTMESLNKYNLTFPFGHPYYQSSSIGYLRCGSWKNYISKIKKANNTFSILKPTFTDINNVLVIQHTNMAPVILDTNLTVKGIVVRRGGILFIDDMDITIKTEFILVESGGLLQAGSNYNDSYRFQSKLTIILTNPPDGYRYMGIVASQYSSTVYFPGAGTKTDLAGETLKMNTFGSKVIAVGFNGSLHLAGSIGVPLPYYGTWSADYTDGTPFVDQTRLLTYFDPISETAEALKQNIATSYPNVWCRLSEGEYSIGTTIIQIDVRDIKKDVLKEWKIGSKIVLTCKTDIYIQPSNLSGMVPIWLDYDDGTDLYNENLTANKTKNLSTLQGNLQLINLQKSTSNGKQTGVEVATIQSIDRVQGSITLQRPLQFNHYSNREVLSNSAVGKSIKVDTNTHIALLTRNILITSERLADTSDKLTSNYDTRGCNVWVNSGTQPQTKYIGPKGHLTCDYNVKGQNCFDPTNTSNGTYCHLQYETQNKPEEWLKNQPVNGHWLLGTSSKQIGCNAIQNGSTMFRLGSSVTLDAIELKYMGQPANFGTIARYAIHFHLCGWIKSFKNYLPDFDEKSPDTYIYSREGLIANCSIWCVPTRWVVTHGSSEITIRNNVGFICYGSGYFVEDGTEIANQFEHNAAICCLPTIKNDYWNPIPIIGNTSSDYAVPSCYWYKNNQTISIRNLGCNSPSSVFHTWMVPQYIQQLKGPSTLCIGDSTLGLPSIGNDKTICWIPDYMKKNKYFLKNSCVAFTEDNTLNPWLCNSENIAYCLYGGLSEFPEAISDSPYEFSNKTRLMMNDSPTFLSNGENSCTDKLIGSYSITQWGGNSSDYVYQPLSTSQMDDYRKTNDTVTTQRENTNIVPKIIANWLTFNLAPDGGGLFGGAGWIKQSPAFLIGCCALKTGGGITYPQYPSGIAGPGDDSIDSSFKESSTMWAMLMAVDENNVLPNAYTVIYDMITNGQICIPATSTYIGGDKTFLTDDVYVGRSEYVNNPSQISVFYISDNLLKFYNPSDSNNFNKFWFTNYNKQNIIRIYDISNPSLINYYDNGTKNSQQVQLTNSNKYPYVCNDNGTLFVQDGEIVINSQCKSFINTYGITLGNKICTNLAKIIGCTKSPSGVDVKRVCVDSPFKF